MTLRWRQEPYGAKTLFPGFGSQGFCSLLRAQLDSAGCYVVIPIDESAEAHHCSSSADNKRRQGSGGT
jgi:hypothetical protein